MTEAADGRRAVLIRRTRLDEAALLPALERSAALAFRNIDGLEWVVSHDVTSEAVHGEAIWAGRSWVAVRDGVLVGFALAEDHGDELHLMELAVAHEAQRCGVGAGLVRAVIAAAEEAGKSSVTLTTFASLPFNEGFYRKLGFERLTAEGMSPRLRACVDHEVTLGLPPERRCAMRRVRDEG